ncbi:hypothetical protein CLAFUW4_02690 [Fulvia fulva]|uniref:Uncharacterized protein n=1 Tax=Passalora fulva TaxID=5499 RepID=A0A9Q8P4P2_PASFU|nr:uncharacterized protein CLAFUR5_02680 [Fulvia fulva]KAK4631852.1 hypothetical protein CLAFUR4_02685 [Fulvia fulva]KAK4632871.1 hypothetical protein CLAFUR0_02687 [Fulvia fulva]UJO13290.1 hypothetical protein CLAFUR5_02680 [Fulvia fulva]WPV10482.1 hypothetical protein CLAFUW4_02690 [Fulvia fulva]WPV25759.1 hypothetical protein CLAFUW7_02689 [Fulvia fulva]
MSTELRGLREQILANAKLMIHPSTISNTAAGALPNTRLPSRQSSTTLVAPSYPPSGELDILVFGDGSTYTSAIMVGITPVIEGGTSTTPEAAMRKLLLATSELLNEVMPELGAHQRAIHGGGGVDTDFLNQDLLDAQKKAS